MKPKCHYDSERGWLTPEHLRDCDDGSCAGCRPCSDGHCGLRGCANHVQHDAGIWTCASCIGKTRNDLATIGRLYAEGLPDEAEHKGVNSEAANLIGPASLDEDHGTMQARTDSERGWCDWPKTDSRHPYTILGGLDMALRETYGPNTSLSVTVDRSIDFLTDLLAGPFPHEDQFEDAANEIRKLRAHMEAVAGDSRAPELGAPCPRCAETGAKAQRLRKRYGSGTEPIDTWHCPTVAEHWWTDADYRARVSATYIEYAPALTADQIAKHHGIPAGRVRSLAAEGKIKRHGYDGQRRQLYDVADALAIRQSPTSMAHRATVLSAPTSAPSSLAEELL